MIRVRAVRFLLAPMRFSLVSRVFAVFLTGVVVTCIFSGRVLGAVELVAPSSVTSTAFPLVASGAAAPIVLPPDAPEVVKIAAHNLADDITAVSGAKTEVLTAAPADKNRPRVEL